MSDIAVRIDRLSKRYRIGVREQYPTIREAIVRAILAPLNRLRPWSSGSPTKMDTGWVWALRDIGFEVKQGEVIGIVGENGAGKSTLLKVLSGITEPTSGYADIYGRVGSLLEVGTGFHMELTGRENIFMNGAFLGMRQHEIKRKFDEIVSFAEVDTFLDTPVKHYSSGMYMRLAFAVAAHLDSDIIVVDEILAVGDAAFQKKCLGKMGNEAQQGRTILFVSHNLSMVQAICQKAVWLDAGTVVEFGPTSQVVHRYLESIASIELIPAGERCDRLGDGSIRARSVRIETVDRQSIIRTSSRLRITIDYQSEKPLRHPRFYLEIYDLSMGSSIFMLDTKCEEGWPDVMPARGTIVCETGPINCTPGRCYVDLSILQGNILADQLGYASQFDVEAEDFFPTGHMPGREWAICVVEQTWSACE